MSAPGMSGIELLLDLALMVLLAATMFHAWRLEKALGVLRRDRAALEELVTGFNESTRQAEGGIERLRATADGAGRQIAKHVEQARSLKDDLEFLTSRGEKLADHLDVLVRATKPPEAALLQPVARLATPTVEAPANRRESNTDGEVRLRSQAEKDLLRALRSAR